MIHAESITYIINRLVYNIVCMWVCVSYLGYGQHGFGIVLVYLKPGRDLALDAVQHAVDAIQVEHLSGGPGQPGCPASAGHNGRLPSVVFIRSPMTVRLKPAAADRCRRRGGRPVSSVAARRLHNVLHGPYNPALLPYLLRVRVHLKQPLQHFFVPGTGPSCARGWWQPLVHCGHRDLRAFRVRCVVDGPPVRVTVLRAQHTQAVLDFRSAYA